LWLSSPHFYPTYGGAQNRYRKYIPGFVERGMDVRIMTGTPQIDERSESDLMENWYEANPGSWLPTSSLDGVPLHRIRLPDNKNYTRSKIYYNALAEMCQEPRDSRLVVQLLTNMRPNATPWLRQLKSNGAAILYSVSQYPKWPQKPVKRLFRHRGYRNVYNEFDALVTNSSAIKEFLLDIGVRTRIEYIPNGVDLNRFHPANSDPEWQDAAAIRSQLGIPAHHKIIVTVGAIMPRKGTDKIIKAWHRVLTQFPDTHLLFVGPRSDIHDPKLKLFGLELSELIETSGYSEKVHFTGNIENVEDYLRASDIFILASDREGTPNSVLEAMASGLPCLVTPYTGISSGIGRANEHYQLIEPNPESIASKLLALLQNANYRSQFGASGQNFVTKHVDQRHTLDRYVELYEELGEMAMHDHQRNQKQ
jgi:glycosyltransferase involved in cell wall biosynthesis